MWEDNKQFPGRVIFLLDTGKDDPPDATENTLGLAHRVLMTYGSEVSVLCRNMRVSTEGGETLYRTARGNGVVIYKYRGNVSVKKAGKCLNVNFEDEYSNIRLNLEADLLVVAEETLPPETAVELSSLSGVETDAEGYLQAENVWMYPTLTNRRGIFVFGEIHSAGDGAVSLEDARAAALEVYDLLGDGNIILGERVGTVDSEKCAVCLTCLRSCPHGAVSINGEEQSAEIVKAACYGCGICSAICPAKAITLEGHTDDDVLRLMDISA
ncbi:Ion-translocating oxidoreductase complex subunit B [subsurface metagenome]